MAKAVFYLKGPKAQHEGNRLLITSKLIEHHFEKGAAFNLPDGRVEVLLEGPRERIIEFHKISKRDFVEWVKEKAEDHDEVRKQIGNPGISFSDLDFDDDLLVHRLEIYGHSLTFDQIYKGVDVFRELNKTNKGVQESNRELQESTRELQKSTRGLQESTRGLQESIRELRNALVNKRL